MAPAESYLDPTRNDFDLSLRHEYEEWIGLIPPFPYHGLNVYAYLLAKFGRTNKTKETNNPNSTNNNNRREEQEEEESPTFDFVTVQLYEGFSHAEFNTSVQKERSNEVLVRFVQKMNEGWTVRFSQQQKKKNSNGLELEDQFVRVPATELVVGLANGWAGDGKFLLIYPEEVSLLLLFFLLYTSTYKLTDSRYNRSAWLSKNCNRWNWRREDSLSGIFSTKEKNRHRDPECRCGWPRDSMNSCRFDPPRPTQG
jgi:hypothetical protein